MLAWRKQQLIGLKNFITENKNEIVESMITDLGRYTIFYNAFYNFDKYSTPLH